MSRLRPVSAKRQAAIDAGTYEKKPRTPLRRSSGGKATTGAGAAQDAGTAKGKPTSQKARRKPVKPVSDKRAGEGALIAAWRQIAIDRADGVCEWCEGPLPEKHPVHHVFEVGAYPHLRLHPANGLACCSTECHDQIHEDLPYARAWWARLNPKFAELAAVTPDVAAIMHPRAAAGGVGEEGRP